VKRKPVTELLLKLLVDVVDSVVDSLLVVVSVGDSTDTEGTLLLLSLLEPQDASCTSETFLTKLDGRS